LAFDFATTLDLAGFAFAAFFLARAISVSIPKSV
jgi:hypothetical protein